MSGWAEVCQPVMAMNCKYVFQAMALPLDGRWINVQTLYEAEICVTYSYLVLITTIILVRELGSTEWPYDEVGAVVLVKMVVNEECNGKWCQVACLDGMQYSSTWHACVSGVWYQVACLDGMQYISMWHVITAGDNGKWCQVACLDGMQYSSTK